MIITYDEPGISYDDPRVTYDGVFTDASVWPAESTVLLGVQYGPNGVDFTGSAIAGNGAQIIAYRSDVRVSTPKLRISSRILRRDALQKNQSINIAAIGKNGIQTCHSVGSGDANVFTNEQGLSVLLTEPRAEVRTQAEELFITRTEEVLSYGLG